MRASPKRGLLWVLLEAGLLGASPATAQGLSPLSPDANSRLPQCGPAMDGQAICRFGLIYECQFSSPSSMERRSGWSWQSEVLRTCERAPDPAELSDNGRTSLPPGFVYAPQSRQSLPSEMLTTPGSAFQTTAANPGGGHVTSPPGLLWRPRLMHGNIPHDRVCWR